jgi:hypothetical protein
MAVKGMSTTLVIIITAVVILVAALVLLTIFGGGMAPVATLSQATAQCTTLAKSSCDITGELPPTWTSKIYTVNGVTKSCADVCGTTSSTTCETLASCK